ncbi:glutathione s-transferase [Holotrichia oblita]|uniref:Glutathione s-transferase n=1 Tax=Holotrichia oblita TaxID=644536 RepID=A0ACB9TXP8_HOLOL|nr:glutathione s-transferase [Holotrichia oblita]
MSDIKITYFNVKALAEATRLLLKYGGIDFVDNRFEHSEWAELKPNMPFGQVPIYEENGKTAHQSVAIARYAAKKVNLVGDDDWENLEIDAIVDTINDFRGKIAAYNYEQDPAIKEARKGPLFQETIPYYLEKFEQIAKDNNGHFAVGKLTWADFFFVGLLDYLNHMVGKNLIEDSPNLQKVVENVTSIPNVKAWIDSRPQTDL